VDNEKLYSSKKYLLNFLGIKENFLYPSFSQKYTERDIPKKNGGVRKIRPPQFNLKKLQRIVLDKILCKHYQLPCVYGLSKDKNIISNAKLHQENFENQLVVLDIENFFPSITKKQVAQVFKMIGFNKENSLILTKICTVDDYLPQGAPTSPYLASLVCLKLDKEIYRYCKKHNFEYTRYFDDISVSGKNILARHIEHIEDTIRKYGFVCNAEKKWFYDTGKDKIINGVLITEKGLSVPDSYKKEIRDIYTILSASPTIENKRSFSGKFGFYLHINKKEATNFLREMKNKTKTVT
jgi:RNA-directed DNA polymerase